MGIKNLFFEEVGEKEENGLQMNQASIDDILGEITPEVDAVVPGAETQDVVADTYAANGLTDLSRSIFKVEELMKTLPSEMQTEVKRQTVSSILTSFQLTVDEVVEDGKTRKATLESVAESITNEAKHDIAETETEIEGLKREIAEKEQDIAQTKEMIKNTESTVAAEVEKIDNLLKFIEG
jgi:vacuolar-type H+-ATPase subunit I/STV1